MMKTPTSCSTWQPTKKLMKLGEKTRRQAWRQTREPHGDTHNRKTGGSGTRGSPGSEASRHMDNSTPYPKLIEQESTAASEEWRPRTVTNGVQNHEKGNRVRKVNVHEIPTFEEAVHRDIYEDLGHDRSHNISRMDSWAR